MKKYRAINPDGGFEESLVKEDLNQSWEIIEIEIEDPKYIQAETEIESLRNQTRSEISSLIFEHTQKLMMRGVPIPEEIQNEYDFKRSQYQEQKQAIYNKYGITNNP